MSQTDKSPGNSPFAAAAPESEPQIDAVDSIAPGMGEDRAGEASPYGNWTSDQREARLVKIEQLLVAVTDASEEQSSLYGEKALLLFASQDYPAAVEAWDQRLAIEPTQAQSWYNRGIALGYMGSHELALESYDRVITLQPDNHIAWGNRAIALRKLGRNEEATEAARRAFELNPEDMVDSFFRQLRLKQPQLAFVLGPIQNLVMRLRGGK